MFNKKQKTHLTFIVCLLMKEKRRRGSELILDKFTIVRNLCQNSNLPPSSHRTCTTKPHKNLIIWRQSAVWTSYKSNTSKRWFDEWLVCADLPGGGLAEELLLLMEVEVGGRTGGLDQVGGSGTSGWGLNIQTHKQTDWQVHLNTTLQLWNSSHRRTDVMFNIMWNKTVVRIKMNIYTSDKCREEPAQNLQVWWTVCSLSVRFMKQC